MSISEIAMLVNDNFNKSLNVQMRELAFNPMYLITSGTSFTPEKSGWYRIICVGKSGGGSFSSSKQYGGGSAGVSISTMRLDSSITYPMTISTSPTTASSFDGTMMAYGGGNATASAYGDGGTATGGDYNYNGKSGAEMTEDSLYSIQGADVGVVISGLYDIIGSAHSGKYSAYTGRGICGYGGGQGGMGGDTIISSSIKPTGCILIIPLELEE